MYKLILPLLTISISLSRYTLSYFPFLNCTPLPQSSLRKTLFTPNSSLDRLSSLIGFLKISLTTEFVSLIVHDFGTPPQTQNRIGSLTVLVYIFPIPLFSLFLLLFPLFPLPSLFSFSLRILPFPLLSFLRLFILHNPQQ